jgi:hypothetical protein
MIKSFNCDLKVTLTGRIECAICGKPAMSLDVKRECSGVREGDVPAPLGDFEGCCDPPNSSQDFRNG